MHVICLATHREGDAATDAGLGTGIRCLGIVDGYYPTVCFLIDQFLKQNRRIAR